MLHNSINVFQNTKNPPLSKSQKSQSNSFATFTKIRKLRNKC
nr:MAG TPA: hypothetical protein [Caudoviricetes sp.]